MEQKDIQLPDIDFSLPEPKSTKKSPAMRTSSRARTLARGVLGGIGLFAASLMFEAGVNPDINQKVIDPINKQLRERKAVETREKAKDALEKGDEAMPDGRQVEIAMNR